MTDAGCFRPPADDAMGVLLEEGIGNDRQISLEELHQLVWSKPNRTVAVSGLFNAYFSGFACLVLALDFWF
jgi:hypothetical protein